MTSALTAQALGIDAGQPGFDTRHGEEFLRLKANGAIALFFFANEDKNDLFADHA